MMSDSPVDSGTAVGPVEASPPRAPVEQCPSGPPPTPAPAETAESLCHWRQGWGDARTESHWVFHFGNPCSYEVVAAVLRGQPDPRDAENARPVARRGYLTLMLNPVFSRAMEAVRAAAQELGTAFQRYAEQLTLKLSPPAVVQHSFRPVYDLRCTAPSRTLLAEEH